MSGSSNGLVRVPEDTQSAPVRNLLDFPAPLDPDYGTLVPPGQTTLVVRNVLDPRHAKAKYVFELEGGGAKEEATVEPGAKETKWTPKTPLQAGEKYTWKVYATEGTWKSPVATSTIVVKGPPKE